MLKKTIVKVGKRMLAVFVLLTAPLTVLWAQEANEKFSASTQMFLNELKEKAEKPVTKPRQVPNFKSSEKMLRKKPQRLIASPDTVAGVPYISCFIHLKDANDLSEVHSLGVEIEETFDGLNFVTARVPVNQLERLATIENVTLIKVAERMQLMSDVARQKTNVDDLLKLSSDAVAQGITNKYDGTGVILGIIDTGIDFQHIAFKDKNGNSRIKRAYVYNGSSGTEYTSITSSSPTTDNAEEDHGTHTASTAGGSSVIVNGSTVTVTDNHANATYGGMAPGADLYLAGVYGLYNTGLTNALKKMVTYADAQNKPLVVSNSWGSVGGGPHDGTGEWADLVSQYFGDNHPNRVILFASSNDAGNSKDNEDGGYFVKKSNASSTSPLGTILRSSMYTNCDGGDFYYGVVSMAWSPKSLNCILYVLDSSTGAVKASWTVTSSTTSFDGLSNYYNGNLSVTKGSENGKYYLRVETNGLESKSETITSQNGQNFYHSNYTLAMEIYPSSGSSNVNMWGGTASYFSNHISTSGHTWTRGTDDMSVSDQATIPNAISVGAYVSKTNWTDAAGSSHSSANVYTMGDIAYFSSYATAAQSPTGLAYPWITAPGARLAAGVNHYHNTSVDDYSYYGNYSSDLVVNNSNSPYAMMQGTSMATPVAAGIVALWLQAAQSVNKSLTVNDVKTIMAQTAIKDSYTTTGSNASHFGKGKIDALAGIKYILEELPEPTPSNDVTIGDNATSSTNMVPYCNYYKNATIQMLYTPAEIGKSGTINSIAFKVANSSSFATSELKVYLGHKSDLFSDSTDFVRSSNLTLVYSGSPTLGQSAGWEQLTFNQGTFNYNGTDNLVVVVTRKSDSWSAKPTYCYFTGSGYTLSRKNDNTTAYGDVTNTSYAYNKSTYRPSIKIEIDTSGDVIIGDDATSSTYRAPYNNYFTYATTQMLYTPAEIGKSGIINSIAFKVANSSSFATSELKVYLGHKSGVFSDSTDFVRSSKLTLVYSGSPTLGQSTGWEKLTFNQGTFNYNGTDNLVVVVAMKSAKYNLSLKYCYFTGSGYTLTRGNDHIADYGYAANTSYAYNKSTYRPSIKIGMEASGTTPTTGIAIDATNFPDVNFRNYLLSQSYGQDGVLTESEIETVISIKVGNKGISSLKGIEHFTALDTLYCHRNQLTALDVTKNTALTYLSCDYNQLTALDVTKNTALTYLACTDNQLTALNLTKNTTLSKLYCYNNQLAVLDVTKNTVLTTLSCYSNQLTALDVSKNTALILLSCRGNQLSKLDVTKNSVLRTLYCNSNKISGVNMDNLISGLRQNTSSTTVCYFRVIDNSDANENNVCTKAQAAAVTAKGWTPQYYDGSTWSEYEGSEDEDPTVFTAESTNGVPMTFKITDEENKTCQIGTGTTSAIDVSTDGDVVLPMTANGYAVTAIAANAFKNCSIHEIVIPNSIRTIGESAFEGCKSSWGSLYVQSFIEEPFDIPESAFSNIGTNASLNSFYGKKDAYLAVTGWDKFTNYYNDLYFLNGILYSVNSAVPEEKGDPYTAWANHSPEWSVYSGEVVIPETFKIGEETFTVVGIDDGAFKNSSITSVSIPKTVRSIDSNAFADCPQLLVVKSYIVEPKDESWSFVNVPANATLYVPAGTKALYETLGGWNLFTTIIEMEDEEPEPDTDISQMDNVLYVDNAEGIADGRMTFFVKMKNSVVAEGFFFRLFLPEGFSYMENLDGKLDVSLYTDENRFDPTKIEFSEPYIDDDGSLVVDAHGKNGYTISGNDGKVVRIRVMVPESTPLGTYPLLIKNGAISDNMGTMWPKGTKPEITCNLAIVEKVRGDANADATHKDIPTKDNDEVNAGDYVTITHYILGLPYETLDMTAGDANGDGVVNGADLTTITLLKKRVKVTATAPRLAKKVEVREAE